MDTALKIAILVLALPLLFAGAGIMFNPEAFLVRLAVSPEGVVGLSTVRSVAGGLLLTSGAMMAYGVLRRSTAPLVAVAVLMAIVSLGRVAGLTLDGVSPETVRPLVVELVLVGLLMAAHRRLGPKWAASAV